MSKELEERERELRRRRKAEGMAANRPEGIRKEADLRKKNAAWELDPPKQYIRREGWEKVLATFIQKIRASDVTRPWKYFTLPGENALDIGHLYRKGLLDVNPEGKLSVAICDKLYGNQVALRLQKFGGILATSERELHEALGDHNSLLVRQFPFDVINLDFTNALILPNLNNLFALDRIFDLQKGQGFLLLLTSRPDKTQQNEHLRILADNLQTVAKFEEAYRARYATNDPSACLTDYTTFTQIVFSKIVARYSREFRYTVHEHFNAKYNRHGQYDMVVHSFELDPIIGRRPDAAKYEPRWNVPRKNRIEQFLMGEKIRQEAEEEYKDYICRLLDRNILNVDEFLASQPELYDELMEETVSLGTWLN